MLKCQIDELEKIDEKQLEDRRSAWLLLTRARARPLHRRLAGYLADGRTDATAAEEEEKTRHSGFLFSFCTRIHSFVCSLLLTLDSIYKDKVFVYFHS